MFNPQDIKVRDKIRFSVIYSFDYPRFERLEQSFAPPRGQHQSWETTEVGESDDIPGWQHYKRCAILNWTQFCEFCEYCGLFADTVETMGSLGAPGFGVCLAPAICFKGDHPQAYQCAYVTPWFVMDYVCSWEPIREWVIAAFSDWPYDYEEDTLADITNKWSHTDQRKLLEEV